MASRNVVHLETRFAEWGAEVETAILAALLEVGEPMAEAAKTAEVRRMSNDLAESIKPLVPTRTPRGFQGGIGAGDFKANWYEYGTLARRSRGKSQRGKSDKAGGVASGVKGLHFMRKGLYASRELVFAKLAEAMREARTGL